MFNESVQLFAAEYSGLLKVRSEKWLKSWKQKAFKLENAELFYIWLISKFSMKRKSMKHPFIQDSLNHEEMRWLI